MGKTQLASEWPDRPYAHRLIQADCLAWLREANEQFDLIFIDPPTFSNSKRMEDAFDVQRDHLALMKDLKRLPCRWDDRVLRKQANVASMDLDGLAKLGLKDTNTQKTLLQDFTVTARSTTAG